MEEFINEFSGVYLINFEKFISISVALFFSYGISE